MPEFSDLCSRDRVRLSLSFDSIRMLEEIQALELQEFVEYDVLPLRSPAHLVDASIAPPSPASDYADGSWTDWLGTPALNASRYLSSVVDCFSAHTRVTLVRLLRLAPGGLIEEHTDPTLGLQIEKSVIRLTIPILTNKGVDFFLNGVPVPMNPGECWYLRLTDPHRVTNGGTTERISMTVDMVPNDWLKTLLTNKSES
jgi:hypothetical protein